MIASNRFFALLLLALCCLCGCKEKESAKITVFRGNYDSLVGPKEDIAQLKASRNRSYSVYYVMGIGSFYLDNRDDKIKNCLRGGCVWEETIVRLLEKHIPSGTTAVDVGAHIGTHTLTMARMTGPSGHTIAFEPQLKLFSELVMNLVLNQCKNVTAYRCAVGNSFNAIEMNIPFHSNEGKARVGKGGDKAHMIPLDSLNLERVSLIKIDAENFEYEVLLGAEQTIRNQRPYIIIEITPEYTLSLKHKNDYTERILHFIADMGYTLDSVDGTGNHWIAAPVL